LKYRYDNAQAAIDDLEKRFPVSKEHHKASLEIQKSKEFFVFCYFLRTNDPLISGLIEIEYIGDQEGFPDCILCVDGTKYFVEVAEMTNEDDQKIYQKKLEFDDSVKGTFNFTAIVKKAIEKKNCKYKQYIRRTGINKSILLLYNNTTEPMVFESSLFDNDLKIEEIKSYFDYTFLLSPNADIGYGKTVSYRKISSFSPDPAMRFAYAG